jgi:hypothetical protein
MSMVIRTYFDRNNTMAYNKTHNTGKNPVSELFYGGGNESGTKYFSRFIFQFATTRIEEFRTKGMFPDLTKLTHVLKMTNTSTFDTSLLGKDTAYGLERASGFDMFLFPVNQTWDEGVGYDFAGQCFFTSLDGEVISQVPSNWVESNVGTAWTNGGGVFTNWSAVTSYSGYTQHFEDGNENLEIDITDIVNGYLTGDTNNGLGLAFDETLENSVLETLKFCGFFTRHTQTFYEPFIETRYANTINDARGNFYMDKLNKLYLYVNVGGVPTDADSISGVTINDNNGDEFSAFTGSSIVHESQGVYSVELIVPTTSFGCVLYEDVWSGVTINGVTRPDIELEFELKDSNEYYNIGDSSSQPKKYTFNVSGIKDNEKINRGDVRKVSVMARVPYSVNQQEVLDSLEYRIYVKEGAAEYSVIDYTSIELAFNYNYFLLDTASLVPGEYYLDIKSTSNYEVNTIKDVVKFEITSQVDERIG